MQNTPLALPMPTVEHVNYQRTAQTSMRVQATGHYTVAYFDNGDENTAHSYARWLRGLGYGAMVQHV